MPSRRPLDCALRPATALPRESASSRLKPRRSATVADQRVRTGARLIRIFLAVMVGRVANRVLSAQSIIWRDGLAAGGKSKAPEMNTDQHRSRRERKGLYGGFRKGRSTIEERSFAALRMTAYRRRRAGMPCPYDSDCDYNGARLIFYAFFLRWRVAAALAAACLRFRWG